MGGQKEINMRICTDCGAEKRNESFYAGPGIWRSKCKLCKNKERRTRRLNDPEYLANERRARNEWYSKASVKTFNKVVESYGGKCSVCGEERYEALLLHHPEGFKGKKRKSGRPYYQSLIDRGYPKEVILLCGTCHLIHHRTKKEES